MTTKLFLAISLLVTSITYSQWTQTGSNINGEAADDFSGHYVSLSSDGNVVAISATGNDGNGNNSGHVRIYENIAGVWTQKGADINGEAAGDGSGVSINLSNDGNVVAIGATFNSGIGIYAGHVRVYEYIAGVWTQIGSDIDGELINDLSGESVSLSNDGTIIAIGALYNDETGFNSGHVRIYENIAGTWTQIGSDINGEGASDNSGIVSLNNDGTIVAIGASNNDGNGNNSGHVRIYENIAGTWTQVGLDIDGEAAGDLSGTSVSLSSDGTIVAIGATGNSGAGNNSGHVRIYENIAGTWTQIGFDINAERPGDRSGWSVSLSDDGSIVAIGSIYNGETAILAGHVRIFKNTNGNWTQIGTDIDGEAASDNFGSSVSLSSDGTMIAISAPGSDESFADSGQVKVYEYNDNSLSNTQNNIPGLILNTNNGNITSNLNNISLTIYNMQGKQIANQNLKGVYMVKATDNKGNVIIEKVLVE